MRLSYLFEAETSVVNQPNPPTSDSPTMAWRPPSVSPATPNTQNSTSPNEVLPNNNQQMIDAMHALDTIKADHLANMPLDQKLSLILQKTAESEKIAYRAMKEVSSFNYKLDRAFRDLSAMIERVSSGKQAKEPDQPGTSIFDEGDPESILGY